MAKTAKKPEKARTKKRAAAAKANKAERKGGLDISKARAKQKEVEERNQSEFHDYKDGWNYFYLGQPWTTKGESAGAIWKEVQRHGFYTCPKHAGKKNCPMCKEIRKRLKRGDMDFVDEWKLKPTAFTNACKKADIKKKDPDAWKALRLPQSVFADFLEWIVDEEQDPSDPTCAVIVGIKRTGKGFKTRYKLKMGEEVDISKYITEEILEGMLDLDTFRGAQPESEKTLRRAIKGKKRGDDDWDDDDDLEEDDYEEDDDLEDDEDDDASDDDGDTEEEDELFEQDDEDSDEEEGDEEEELEDEDEDDEEEEPEDDGDEEDDPEDDEDDLDDDLDLEDEDDEEEPEEEPAKKPAKKSATKKSPPKEEKPAKDKKPKKTVTRKKRTVVKKK